MTDTSSILVVLIDADDIKHVFSAWPDHICLAACLTRDGDCSMVVFRRDERAAMPKRLLDMLGVDSNDVCFVPKVRGFETRSFLYSDERRLMALVASDPDLLDEAIDYAINYTYALEEGLDPYVILGLDRPAAEVKPREPAAPVVMVRPHIVPQPQMQRAQIQQVQTQKPQMPPREVHNTQVPMPHAENELSPLLPEFLRKSAEGTRRPKFASVRTARDGMFAAAS
ncbi:flagellar motor protein [Sulfitobacter pacificus]|uniref:Uncharacterized protein n=1 Tax=Sulfitobacter pacificus TaxID=1499314 RepID=A0ABQ5VM62_9RHOB|nr:flagellar motor protein [Sulfitobacter pacificus]GLQ28156.1 hypothetical protein GCM10007927_29590 [Sulfitobacter pacificus]